MFQPFRIGVAALATVALAACGTMESGLTGTAVDRDLQATIGDEGRAPAQVELCKVGPVGTSATFSIVADGGVTPLGETVIVQAQPADILDREACPIVWRASEPVSLPEPIVNVTVTEVSMTPGTALEKIYFGTSVNSGTLYPPTNSISLQLSFSSGAVLKFFNVGIPTDGGGEGCTPGYWKQSQHFDSWTTPYAPATQFSSVFADAFPGMTLLDVVSTGGGGLNALGRHTVAALLNAASGEVDNGMTSAGVVSAFNAAFASGDYETQKNIFEASNEMGCPLN